VLIDTGADLEARDATWNDTPLGWAIVGSGFSRTDPKSRKSPNADFVATVRTLVEAGASLEHIHPGSDKPPSQEIGELLLGYGISSSIV
jgi:hypothetical protein